MSYDITISADDSFSASTSFASLSQFLSQIPKVARNGTRGFALREGERLWMEIDLESVTDEGDIRDDGDSSETVNCVRLHIPYPFLGKTPEQDYFPTAVLIAEHLGWSAMDDQTGTRLKETPSHATSGTSKRRWWQFR